MLKMAHQKGDANNDAPKVTLKMALEKNFI